MPWQEATVMSRRKEFVTLTQLPGAHISELCRRFGISRKTGYKWISRSQSLDPQWAEDRSRRPRRSPGRVLPETERAVLAVRESHPAWGGRKIRKWLEAKGGLRPPAASTIAAILHRHHRIPQEESDKRSLPTRFEWDRPNALWQMDYKGQFVTLTGECHPLTIVDDHSRYALCVAACPDEQEETVRRVLQDVFRLYGLPERMLMDNGSCWKATDSRYTKLTAWLWRLGVGVSHSRPYHPQTQGKNERFNRTLKAEALAGRFYHDLAHCQRGFDHFRQSYNHERPHEALGMAVPASRYRISPFACPQTLPAFEYLPTDEVRQVGPAGYISYRKRRYQVGRAFSGDPVALRPTDQDGIRAVYYCRVQVAILDLRTEICVQC